MLDHYRFQLKVLNKDVNRCLRIQCMDEASPWYGTIENYQEGLDSANTAISLASRFVTGYCFYGGDYDGNGELLRRAAAAMGHALTLMHDDGTVDLLSTNFHDASETAFGIQLLGPAYLMLKNRRRDSDEENRLLSVMYKYIDRAADGMLSGGFHTPNHRWVHASALALCAKITGREDCLVRMREFLNEGIDCDEEGEYTERSSGVYNTVCDRSLIWLAEIADMPELLTHVERNLDMVLKYVEPDFTVNTSNSTRQDANTAPDWRIYYGLYLYMALRCRRSDFAWAADTMLMQSDCSPTPPDKPIGPGCEFMCLLMLHREELFEVMKALEPAPPADHYIHYFASSGIVRARQGDITLTLVKDKAQFAALRIGSHPVYLRLAGSFYSKGQFVAQSIEQTDDGWRMSFHVRWGYKRPLPIKPESPDWRKMDHSLREDVLMQDFGFTVDIHWVNRGIDLDIASVGQDGVPVKLEMITRPGAFLFTDDIETQTRAGDYYYQKCNRLRLVYPDRRIITIDGGFASHRFGRDMRGTLSGDKDHVFIAMTALTPLRRNVMIRCE